MTDHELLSRVMGILDPGAASLRGLFRSGRLLLGLPVNGRAACHALRLYQPQRSLARGIAALLRGVVKAGGHRMLLPVQRISCEAVAATPSLSGIEAGTCGVMLGSPEHRVRRAIASYRNAGAWEVAKISFGEEGGINLEREARVLNELQHLADGVPSMLGLHRAGDATILRMPYLTGMPLDQGGTTDAVELLDRWITDLPPRRIDGFPEWEAIESALAGGEAGKRTLERISRETLRPAIRHGDFARWNLLRRDDGTLTTLDWEWGHEEGMPGLDLVHYFLQDARLVDRLGADEAIRKTIAALESPPCRDHLQKAGWSDDAILPIVASLAFKQGAGHQENSLVLTAAIEFACGKHTTITDSKPLGSK